LPERRSLTVTETSSTMSTAALISSIEDIA
jgi:hypothetical protein